MLNRNFCKNRLPAGCLLLLIGCGHHSGKVPVATAVTAPETGPTIGSALPATRPAAAQAAPMVSGELVQTYKSTPPAVQFDYPADWVPDKAQTACLAVRAPGLAGYSSLSLDIPKLPWHPPGMITLGMVCSGYLDDLKKHEMPDAVVNEKIPISVCGCAGQRITSKGHENGHPSIDMAVILVHSDHVYVISADSDETGYDTAKKTLDAAVASWKWTK